MKRNGTPPNGLQYIYRIEVTLKCFVFSFSTIKNL
jgi:hypothetical protein